MEFASFVGENYQIVKEIRWVLARTLSTDSLLNHLGCRELDDTLLSRSYREGPKNRTLATHISFKKAECRVLCGSFCLVILLNRALLF
jgi:hypothetical protein